MAASNFSPWRVAKARYRLAIAVLVGLVAAGITLALGGKELAPIVGWDLTVITFAGWVWLTVWRMDAPATKSLASSEDPTQASTDALILVAAVASLGAVAVVLVLANSAQGAAKAALAALAIISVGLSWLMLHTLFTLRYAWLYYREQPEGGIDFNQDEPPQYSDFAYLGFTLGDDLPGVRHRSENHTHPCNRLAARVAVLPVRGGHPGDHHQPHRGVGRLRLRVLPVAGELSNPAERPRWAAWLSKAARFRDR